MTVTAEDVVAAWERLEAASGVLGVRRENKLAEEADRLVAQALADSAVLSALLTLLDSTSDEELKEWLRSRLLPDVVDAESDPDSFRSHPLVDFTAEQMPIRPSVALVEVKGKVKKRDVLADLDVPGSWLAGAPVSDTREWPVDDSGLPLAHIVQLDLSDASEGGPGNRLAELDLPQTGVLQLFHDLGTYGWEAPAGKSTGWPVRWVQQPTRLLKRHPDLDSLSFKSAQPVHTNGAISIPSPDGFRPGSTATWERYERVAQHIEDQIRTPFNLGTMKPADAPVPGRATIASRTPPRGWAGSATTSCWTSCGSSWRRCCRWKRVMNPSCCSTLQVSATVRTGSATAATCKCGSGAATWPPACSPTSGASAAPSRPAPRASRSSG